MPESCPECGAAVPEGGACRDLFDAVLLLEWQIPGGPGPLAHYLAVTAYGLQHPDGVGYTPEAWAGLRAGLSDLLDGRVTLDEHRLRTRRAADGAARVRRRDGEAWAGPAQEGWPVTAADVLAVGADAEAYAGAVERWARAVRDTLDAGPT